MFSTKLGFHPRIIRHATKSYNIRYDSIIQSNNYTSLAPIYNLKSKYQETQVYDFKNNGINSSKYKIGFNLLKYSTNPIEVPPLPPPPPADEDVFGSIGGAKYESVELDKEELKEEERYKDSHGRVPRKFKPSPGQYAQMIKNYVQKGDLNAAQEVIEECKRNRDKPTDYMFTLLIYAFAQQGDIKTCYRYFSQMKDRRFKIKANTYTSLLNACANSTDSEKALNYLSKIIKTMKLKNFPINHAHYNVMVKAYGRHNNLEEANKLILEMVENRMKIGISTINSLLYGANSDEKSGLKHILHYWQLMRRQKIPPDLFSYNLLLRGIRDTNFGGCTVEELFITDGEDEIQINTDDNRPDLLSNPPVISNLPLPYIKTKSSNAVKALLDPLKPENSISTSSTTSKSIENNSNTLPVSMALLDLDSILKQNKLILFGGFDELLKKMKNDRITPNIKTLTYLIELVPHSIAAEDAIIKYAKTEKIPLDIDFFNMLIKKRSLRGAKKEAKEILEEIRKADLRPNIVTYGVLALSCTTANEGRQLISTLKSTGHTINKFIADALLTSAFDKRDFGFILELMEKMKSERIRLDDSTFKKMDEFQQKMTALIKRKEKVTKKDSFKIGFSKFNMRYKSWQTEMGRKLVTEHASKQT